MPTNCTKSYLTNSAAGPSGFHDPGNHTLFKWVRSSGPLESISGDFFGKRDEDSPLVGRVTTGTRRCKGFKHIIQAISKEPPHARGDTRPQRLLMVSVSGVSSFFAGSPLDNRLRHLIHLILILFIPSSCTCAQCLRLRATSRTPSPPALAHSGHCALPTRERGVAPCSFSL